MAADATASAISLCRVSGEPGVVLRAGRMEATFLPGCGMLGTSLRFDGEEHLSVPGGLRAWRSGHTTGLPIVYPWANRLGSYTFSAAGKNVSLLDVPEVHLDGNGLPIHGTLAASPDWDIEALATTKRTARLTAAYTFTKDGPMAAAFPFPHRLEVAATVRDDSLTVTTSVTPTTKQAVPVSFGWHPYFTVPGVPRAELALMLPKRRGLELDSQQLPTGERTREAAETAPLGARTFDHLVKLGRDRVLGLGGGGRGLTIELDEGYPYAQVYAPPRRRFVALEPMTAPINALVDGQAPLVSRGETFSATFTIRIGHT